MIVVEVFCKGPVVDSLVDLSTILQRAESLLLPAAPGGHQRAQSVCGSLRDDVDDAVHGVGAPHRPPGPADYFDSVNVLQRHIYRVPIHAPEQWGIDGPA